MNSSECCIVVPLHKDRQSLSDDEQLSLWQLYKVLGNHTIYLIGPPSVAWEEYISEADQHSVSLQIKTFKNGFGTPEKHNRLLLTTKFYRSFREFKFMMIYHLDAFVFRDELHMWCQKDYDYIGCPWFEGWQKATLTSQIIGGGNGGFSLRKIQTCRKMIPRMRIINNAWKIYKRLSLQRVVSFSALMTPVELFFKTHLRQKATTPLLLEHNLDRGNSEDMFFGHYFPILFLDYHLAPVEDAIKFGFEMYPSRLFEINGKALPFGCHAWKRYEWSFWKEYIADVKPDNEKPEQDSENSKELNKTSSRWFWKYFRSSSKVAIAKP